MGKILVLGSLALDEVVFLRSALREGAHLEGEGRGVRLGGGAANTGGALAYAGHHVLPVAPVGNDEEAALVMAEVRKTGADTSLIKAVEGRTTRSIVMIDGKGERTIVNLARAREPEPPVRLLAEPADCLFVRSQALDLADLMAKKAESCLVVAHMPPFGAATRPAQVLVASQSDLSPQDLADPWKLGQGVAGDILEWVVVTLGERGAVAYGKEQTLKAPAPKVEPLDTTGAGDAFAAGLVHGLVSGLGMADSLVLGCAFGAEATQWEASLLPFEGVEKALKH